MYQLGDLSAAETELACAVALHEQHRPGTEDLAGAFSLHGVVLVTKGRTGERDARIRSLRRFQQALVLRRRLYPRDSNQVEESLENLGTARADLGQDWAALRLYRAALSIGQRIFDPDDVHLGGAYMNVGSTWTELGRADEGEPLLRQSLEIWRNAHADSPQHPSTSHVAGWLAFCLLVRARAGEDTAARRAEARRLCDEFDRDFAEQERIAERTPYTPGSEPGA